MRKIIAFTSICFLSLLLKNETGNCKTNCEVSKKVIIKRSDLNADLNADFNNEPVYNSLTPYDGFFLKI